MEGEHTMSTVTVEEAAFEARKALEEVYSILGPGFDVEPYKRAFAQELTRRRVPYDRNVRIPVTYKEATVGEYTLDYVLYGKLYVRIAAEGGHPGLLKSQVAAAVKAAKLHQGVLVDMNVQSFKMHQVINPEFVLGTGASKVAEEGPPETLPRQERKKPKGS
jgi:GxxExxY protein